MRKPESARCAAFAWRPCSTDGPTDRSPGGFSRPFRLLAAQVLPVLPPFASFAVLTGGSAASSCGTTRRALRSPFAESTLWGSVKARTVPPRKIAQAP